MGLRAKTAASTTLNSTPVSAKHKLLNGARKFNKSFSRSSSGISVGTPSPPCLSPTGKLGSTDATCSFTTSTICTTFRSSSTSALFAASLAANMRPQTLNVHNHQQTPADHTQLFLGYVYFFLYVFFPKIINYFVFVCLLLIY